MAGINQHFIPQSLLRRFGHKKKSGKASRVAVYEQHKMFVTATTGAAAERFFYSGLSRNGEQTLDDRITEYEPRLTAIFAALDSAGHGTEIDAQAPAELIAHLCIRNSQVRESFGHIAGQLLDGALDMFTDPNKRWKTMGMDKQEPPTFMLEEYNKLYDATGMGLRGMSRNDFAALCFGFAKMQFDPSDGIAQKLFDGLADAARGVAPSMAKDGHSRALEKGLVPQARREALQGLRWYVHDTDFDLVLPDCIAIDWPEPDRCRAFAYCPNTELAHVVMPVASRRYLVGACDGRPHDVKSLNLVLAQCSWRFFVARDREERLKALSSEIGTVTRSWAENEIQGALATVELK